MANATFSNLFGSDLLLHADASAPNSLFTDAACTSLASDASEVKGCTQQSDATITTPFTGTNGPTYRANYASSGYPALEFDGVNDRLGVSGVGLTIADFMVLCCFTRISGTASTVWYRGNNIANLIRQLYTGDAGHQIQYGIASSYAGPTISTSVTGRNVWASALRTNQTELNVLGLCNGLRSTPYGGTLADAFYIGAGESSGILQPANMAFNEILVIGSNCEWGQVIRAAKIMRNKWGVTDPNALPQYTAPGGVMLPRPMNGGYSA